MPSLDDKDERHEEADSSSVCDVGPPDNAALVSPSRTTDVENSMRPGRRRRTTCLICLAIKLVIVFIVFFSGISLPHPFYDGLKSLFEQPYSTSDAESCLAVLSNASRLNQKVILLASDFFGEVWTWDPLDGACPVQDCVALPSNCRSVPGVIEASNAIILHAVAPNLARSLRALPFLRLDRPRLWKALPGKVVFYSLETPDTLYKLKEHYRIEEVRRLWDLVGFNWSQSYRLDSDIVEPYAKYDGYVRLEDSAITQPPKRLPNNRRHLAALISNCDDSYGRINLLDDLRREGLSVDVYGRCGNMGECPYSKCNGPFFETNYFFFAAFENSICTDYVSEKLYNRMSESPGLIPVVVGGANYSAMLPPNSVINTNRFATVKELANFLLKVASDPELFDQFLLWRRSYRMTYNRRHIALCAVCRRLSTESTKMLPKIEEKEDVHQIQKWWTDETRCRKTVFRE